METNEGVFGMRGPHTEIISIPIKALAKAPVPAGAPFCHFHVRMHVRIFWGM